MADAFYVFLDFSKVGGGIRVGSTRLLKSISEVFCGERGSFIGRKCQGQGWG
jgi:hypothetical protein